MGGARSCYTTLLDATLLGGMLEQGETPAECVRREIEEKIGVALDADLIEHYATRDCVFGIEPTSSAQSRTSISTP
ncbi:NUDIX domain-containing protein [Nocardia sp. NPDC003693]